MSISRALLLFAILLIAVALSWILYRRYSRNKIYGVSEATLFVTAVLILSLVNSYGILLQFYLAHLIDWKSYNIHDLLVGSDRTIGRPDLLTAIASAWPVAAICCTVSLLVAHFQERPIRYWLVATLWLFVTTACGDLLALGLWPKTPTTYVNFLSDALGAPVLALIATGLYFFTSKTASRARSLGLRLISIALMQVTFLISIVVFIFAFERLFLIP